MPTAPMARPSVSSRPSQNDHNRRRREVAPQVEPYRSNDNSGQPMTHTRIRKFNTKDSYPEQKLDNDLCQAVVARGSIVFVRGQVGQDLDTAVNVGVGDAEAQAEKAMANIKQLLSEAGARLEHICKVTIYLTDPRFREPVYRTIGRWLKGVYPVSTGIVVAGLARPDWLRRGGRHWG